MHVAAELLALDELRARGLGVGEPLARPLLLAVAVADGLADRASEPHAAGGVLLRAARLLARLEQAVLELYLAREGRGSRVGGVRLAQAVRKVGRGALAHVLGNEAAAVGDHVRVAARTVAVVAESDGVLVGVHVEGVWILVEDGEGGAPPRQARQMPVTREGPREAGRVQRAVPEPATCACSGSAYSSWAKRFRCWF